MASTTSSDQINRSASSGDIPAQFQSLPEIHSDDEEEDLCRICRCGATSDDPLHYPCACRGSIKFVHQNCLLQWIKHSGGSQCEVCRHSFAFIPIYADKAPSRLSLGEQICWIAGKAWTGSQFLTRLTVVLFVWFVIVPLVAAQIWDMIFMMNRRELEGFYWLYNYRTIFYEITRAQVIVVFSMLVGAALCLCLEFLGENRIPPVGNGPNGIIFDGNESFGEIIGMKGPVINLVKRAFKVQLVIGLLLVIGVLIPFSLGRIMLYQMSIIRNGVHGHASNQTMLAVGYLSILGPGVIAVGLYFIRRLSKEITLNTILKALSTCGSFVLRLVRQGVIFMVIFGVFPWICGLWFDICTMKLVQLQLGSLELALVFPPLQILVCWACGIFSLVAVRKFLLIISEELQQGILDFLQIPTDINQNWIHGRTDASLHENAYCVLVHTGAFMILLVVLVFLPFKLVMNTVPSFFPLNFILCYSPSGLHWNTLGRLLRSHYFSRHYNPYSVFKFLLHHWLSLAGRALELDEFLLPMNEDANGNLSRVDHVKELHDGQVDSKLQLVLKIAALLILGSVSLVLFASAMLIVPISLGRAVFSLILWVADFSIGRNDEINFLVGCYIISDGIVAVRSFINFVGTRRVISVLQIAGRWCIIGLKSFALLSVSCESRCNRMAKHGFEPKFEYKAMSIYSSPGVDYSSADLTVEMPLDLSLDEKPVFDFHQIWIMGCLLLSAWYRLVMSDVRDRTFFDWRVKFERVKADGFSRLRAFWILREILCPIIFNLLNWLCTPYMFAKGFFPLLGYSIRANSTVYHFAWFGYLVLSVLWYVVKKLCIWLGSLHDRMKDDRYLIGKTLCNYGEECH